MRTYDLPKNYSFKIGSRKTLPLKIGKLNKELNFILYSLLLVKWAGIRERMGNQTGYFF